MKSLIETMLESVANRTTGKYKNEDYGDAVNFFKQLKKLGVEFEKDSYPDKYNDFKVAFRG